MRLKITKNIVPAKLLSRLKRAVVARVRPKVPVALSNVKVVMARYLDESPELNSLLGSGPGSLRVHFGLDYDYAVVAVNAIKAAWIDSVTATDVQSGAASISFRIFAAQRSRDALVNLPEGSYVSPRSGQTIDWLPWLLLEANSIKIVTWWMMSKASPSSRSGEAIMVPSGKSTRFWAIPAPFDQDERHNFINRIINSPSFQTDVERAIRDGLGGLAIV